MIMRWKTEGENHVTEWQGIQFLLTQDAKLGRWVLYANGKRVRQTWTKARVAMEQIDTRQQALVVAASKTYGVTPANKHADLRRLAHA